MIQSLRLAKIPEKLVTAIETLTKQWSTIVQLHWDQNSITSDVINFSNGIFQGNSISVLLFILFLLFHTCLVSLRAIIMGMADEKQ